MGHQNNITDQTFGQISQLLHKSVTETKLHIFHLLEQQKNSKFKEVKNEEPQITEMFIKAATAWGQPVDEARRYTYDLLQYEAKSLMKKQ